MSSCSNGIPSRSVPNRAILPQGSRVTCFDRLCTSPMVIGVVSEYPSNWRIFCIISYNLYFIKQFAYNAKTLINTNLNSDVFRRLFSVFSDAKSNSHE